MSSVPYPDLLKVFWSSKPITMIPWMAQHLILPNLDFALFGKSFTKISSDISVVGILICNI